MFRKMKNDKKQMLEEEAVELLQKGEYGILSIFGDDGYPYGVPVNYAYDNGSIYFHSSLEGHMKDGIAKDNKVSFCVVGKTELMPEEFSTKYESVIAFGKAEGLKEFEEKKEGFLKIIKKYSEEYLEKGEKCIDDNYDKFSFYRINIEHLTGKKSED